MKAQGALNATPDNSGTPADPRGAARSRAYFVRVRIRAAAIRFRASLTGLPPETIALIFAIGLVFGVFPVYGVPTILCAAVAIVFRLNLPAIQLINQICSPLQLALAIPFGRAGARILGIGLKMRLSPAWNIADAARNAVVGWCCLCVPLGLVFYLILAFALHNRQMEKLKALENPAW